MKRKTLRIMGATALWMLSACGRADPKWEGDKSVFTGTGGSTGVDANTSGTGGAPDPGESSDAGFGGSTIIAGELTDCTNVTRTINACVVQLGGNQDPTIEQTCETVACADTDKQKAIACVLAATCDDNYQTSVVNCAASNNCPLAGFETQLQPGAACNASPDTPPAQFGNPDGYAVHTLTSDGLCSKAAAINGISVNTSSPDAIDASIQSMIASTNAPTVVAEVTTAVAELSVDFTHANSLPSSFYGFNLQWHSKYFLKMENYRALARNMRLDILRFPGGQERVEYLRNQPTKASPGDELGADQPYQYVLTSEDVANYIDFCKQTNINAQVEINLYNLAADTLGQHADGPSMAADMVDQIVNELGYDLRYISVGNEPEANNASNWSYFTTTNGTPVTSAAEAFDSYMRRFLQYRAALEQVHPGMTYALAETGAWEEPTLGQNLDLILGNLQGIDPGALSIHWYPLGEWTGQRPTDPSYPSLAHLVISNNQHHEISYLRTIAETAQQKLQNHGLRENRLILGEWGPAWSATNASSQLQDRMVTALFSAEVQEFTKTLGFDTVEYFGLSDPVQFAPWNPAPIVVDGIHVAVRPQYYVYVLYKYLYGDEIVSVPSGQNDDWSVYASRSQGGATNHLMLINRTADRTLTKVVQATTAQGTRQLRLTLYPHSVSVVSF